MAVSRKHYVLERQNGFVYRPLTARAQITNPPFTYQIALTNLPRKSSNLRGPLVHNVPLTTRHVESAITADRIQGPLKRWRAVVPRRIHDTG